MNWHLSWRADPAVRPFADRHYSRKTVGAAQFVPPGRCLVLRAEGAYWITSWPFEQYVKNAWPGAWMCSAFRNERPDLYRSSNLVLEAVAATRAEFGPPPPLGMVTFVNEAKVRPKRDPGRCFRRAGFIVAGRTKTGGEHGGLLVLQLLPDAMPGPEPALGMTGRLIA